MQQLYREATDTVTFFSAVINHGCGGALAPCLVPLADAAGMNEKIPSARFGGFALGDAARADFFNNSSFASSLC
jgi:hypothetical protein